jgi:tetratricopeptide (TPR) repeat protein
MSTNGMPEENTALSWRIGGVVVLTLAVVIIAALLLTNTGNEVPNEGAGALDDEAVTQNEPAGALDVTGMSAEELFRQGEQYYRQGEWANAIAAYEAAIDQNPNYDAAYTNLGSTYYRQGNLDAAINAYEQALTIQPDDPDTHHNLGMVYLQLWLAEQNDENLQSALNQVNMAIELEPNLPAPYYGLGVIYQVQGDTPAAIEAFQTFLELDDGSDPTATDNANLILQQLQSQ